MDKEALDGQSEVTEDVTDSSSNSEVVKGHDQTALSYAPAQRDLPNTMELVEAFKTVGGKCIHKTFKTLIKTANNLLQGCNKHAVTYHNWMPKQINWN